MTDGIKTDGFTIIEMIIALLFLAIILLASGNTAINVAQNGGLTRKTSLACNLCQAKIEALKAIDYDAIADSQENNLDSNGQTGEGVYARTVTVSPGPISNTKLVTVTVSWANGSRSVSLRTLVADL